MGYHDALRDDIRMEHDHIQTLYFPRCMFCGQEHRSWNYITGRLYLCPACRPHKRLLLETGLISQGERKCD